MKRFISSFFLVLLVSLPFGQTVQDLKKQRLNALKEIEQTASLLAEKSSTKQSTLTNLNLLTNQISRRKLAIANMEIEVTSLDEVLGSNLKKLDLLSSELEQTKHFYRQLLYHTYFKSTKFDALIFILSSDNLSMAYQRYLFLVEFSNYVKKQGDRLLFLHEQQIAVTNNIKSVIEQKQDVLSSLSASTHVLSQEKLKKESLVKDLEKEEAWLKKDLASKEKKAKALDDQIQALIRAELAAKNKSGQKFLPSEFAKAKGLLPWPVANGSVVSFFGQHDHPVLKHVKVNNNGIDLEARRNSDVMSVFLGQVSKVIAIPGYNMAVIIRHGNYLSVYANLAKVHVSSGETVKEGTVIGSLFAEADDSRSTLHFEIWRENEKIDPLSWLKK